jgi:hypothetical protein
MGLKEKLSKTLKIPLTIILIPHSPTKPRKITFTLSFLLFVVLCWTGLTIWAGYVNGRHIDYCITKFNHEVMRIKLLFFANEVKKSQEFIDEVRERDEHLRSLLDMKTKKKIITSDGKGGPGVQDRLYLQKFLSAEFHNLSIKDLHYQIKSIQQQVDERVKSVKEINKFINYQSAFYRATPNIWPTRGRITSSFGMRMHPFTGRQELHKGIDIANKKKTPIYATADGKVKYVGWIPGYGRIIVIEHGFNCQTRYGHLSKALVKYKQRVKKGQKIGLMGKTGKATSTHLHYEVLYKLRAVNPKWYLNRDVFFSKTKKRR